LESAATIEEVSLKMRDTAGGTPALPLKKQRLIRADLLEKGPCLFAIRDLSHSRQFAFIRGSTSFRKCRRREAASPYLRRTFWKKVPA
jgi:hypothetical protein